MLGASGFDLQLGLSDGVAVPVEVVLGLDGDGNVQITGLPGGDVSITLTGSSLYTNQVYTFNTSQVVGQHPLQLTDAPFTKTGTPGTFTAGDVVTYLAPLLVNDPDLGEPQVSYETIVNGVAVATGKTFTVTSDAASSGFAVRTTATNSSNQPAPAFRETSIYAPTPYTINRVRIDNNWGQLRFPSASLVPANTQGIAYMMSLTLPGPADTSFQRTFYAGTAFDVIDALAFNGDMNWRAGGQTSGGGNPFKAAITNPGRGVFRLISYFANDVWTRAAMDDTGTVIHSDYQTFGGGLEDPFTQLTGAFFFARDPGNEAYTFNPYDFDGMWIWRNPTVAIDLTQAADQAIFKDGAGNIKDPALVQTQLGAAGFVEIGNQTAADLIAASAFTNSGAGATLTDVV